MSIDITEISAHLDLRVGKGRADLYYIGREAVIIQFSDIAAWSRAMNAVKESPEYQAWLTRAGLA